MYKTIRILVLLSVSIFFLSFPVTASSSIKITSLWQSTLGLCFQPNLTDLDGDGNPDIVGLFQDFSTEEGTVHIGALSGVSGMTLWKIANVMPGACRDFPAGDVTGNDKVEVIAWTGDEVVMIEGATGKILRSFEKSESTSLLRLVNLQGRPGLGVLVAEESRASLYSGTDGGVIWSHTAPASIYNALIEDFDGSGDSIVLSLEGGIVSRINSQDGEVIWSRKLGTGYEWAYTASGDVTGDGKPDLLASLGIKGQVMILDPKDGKVREKIPGEMGRFLPVDLNGDGIAVVVGLNGLSAYDVVGGNYIWKAPSVVAGQMVSVVDLDNDGIAEIIAATMDGSLAIINGSDGRVMEERAIGHHAPYLYPVAGDFNGDGMLNLFYEDTAVNLNARGRVLWMGNGGDASFSGSLARGLLHGAGLSVSTGVLAGPGEISDLEKIFPPDLVLEKVESPRRDPRIQYQPEFWWREDFTPRLVWRSPVNQNMPGMMADVTGDGNLELVTFDMDISVVDGSTGRMKWTEPSRNITGLGAVGNYGSQGILLFFGDQNGYLSAHSGADGRVVWSRKVGTTRLDDTGPVVFPFRDKNSPDLIVFNGSAFEVISDSTTVGVTAPLDCSPYAPPAVGDLTGDGSYEYCIADRLGNLSVYKYPGKQIWKFQARTAGDLEISPVIGDLDGDGAQDVILSGDTTLAVSVKKQKILWKSPYGTECSLALADFNRDGVPDVVLMTSEVVRVLDGVTGKPLMTVNLPDEGGIRVFDRLSGGPVCADLNGDGHIDILVRVSSSADRPDVHFFNQSYLLISGRTESVAGRFTTRSLTFAPPLLGDMDGDGNIDMAVSLIDPVSGESRSVLLSFGGGGKLEWPRSTGDPGNTRNYMFAREYADRLSRVSANKKQVVSGDYPGVIEGDRILDKARDMKDAGDFAGAEKLIKTAREQYRRASYPRGEILCRLLGGEILFLSGSLSKGEEELKAVREDAESIGCGSSVQSALLLLARINGARGDFRDAVKNLAMLEKMPRSKFGVDEINAGIFSLRGGLYFQMGDYGQALDNLHKSIEYSRSLESQAEAINRTGVYLGRMGRHTGSAENLLRSVNLYNQMKMSHMVARVFLEMARVYRQVGGYSQSLRLQERSLELSGGGMSSLAPSIFTGMGFNLLNEKKPREALVKFQEALKYINTMGGENPLDSWQADFGAAKALEAVGDDDNALKHYRSSVEGIEKLRREISAPESRSTFFEDKLPVYEGLIRLLLRKNLGAEAFNYSEAARARAFAEMLGSPRFEQVLEKDGENWSNLQKIRMEIASLRNRIAREDGDTRGLIRQLEQARERLVQYTVRIRTENPRLAVLSGDVKPVTAGEASRLVRDKDTAIVEYFCGEDFLAVWIINHRGMMDPIIIDTSRQALSRRIARLRRPITDMEQLSGGSLQRQVAVLERFNLREAHSLYRLVFEEVHREISATPGISRLIIIPDGPLHFYPFEALVTSVDGGDDKGRGDYLTEFGRASYLLQEYSIIYSPSVTLLDSTLRRKGDEAPTGLVALGDPVYTREDLARHQEEGFTLASGDMRSHTFLPLPNSLREIESIAGLFSAVPGEAQVYSGPLAREDKARENIGAGRFIHFSCHGILNQQSPMFSGLVLSQPSALGVDSDDDGFLEVYEIFSLSLNARLVVLSACQTGLGRYVSGEGIMGLSRAFMYAGADQVVVSLWAVADESTSRLMSDFYREMIRDGQPVDEALRQARIKLMKTSSSSGVSYSHPFFWAPFVIMGRGGKTIDARGFGVVSGAGGSVGGMIMAPKLGGTLSLVLK